MLYLETKIIPRLTPGEFYFKETNMKKYKRIFSIILLVILVALNVVPIYGATKTNVYASTEEEFYQYVNEFMKGDYEELIIHIPKNEFKIDEYKKGDNTHNMVEDVSKGFSKTLLVNGVGYRAEIKGKVLTLALGYSTIIEYMIPEGITITSDAPGKITVSGIDKAQVGQVSAEIRSLRGPEPYKGKGIKYETENIRRKVGKSGGKK